MSVVTLTSPAELDAYRAWLNAHPQNNLWQSLERAAYCKAIGLQTKIFAVKDGERFRATALVTIDAGRMGTMWEVPRGPLWNAGDDAAAQELCDGILASARAEHVLAVYLSPMNPLPHMTGWKDSGRGVHAEATRVLNLECSEAELVAQMHPKGRYNIRVAEKNNVTVRESDDVQSFYAILKETGARDRFGILPRYRYQAFLGNQAGSFLLLAEHNKVPVAGLLGVIYSKQGIYYYGASSYKYRNLMAPYALQWAAIQRCKAAGCVSYDLLGIAPLDGPDTHSWAGISEFKAKFGGTVVSYPKEQVAILRPWAFRALQLKRSVLG
jgi:lipid II:glycine glycyltransferase (peptidoglycan interpeptide bridge formation enzyme)